MFYYSFTSQVVLKHLNEFGASIIVDFKRKNKLKERHVEDGGIGGGGGSIELSGGGGGRNNEAFIPECALKMVQVKNPAIWEQGLLPLLRT